jgi:hypothetical protein
MVLIFAVFVWRYNANIVITVLLSYIPLWSSNVFSNDWDFPWGIYKVFNLQHNYNTIHIHVCIILQKQKIKIIYRRENSKNIHTTRTLNNLFSFYLVDWPVLTKLTMLIRLILYIQVKQIITCSKHFRLKKKRYSVLITKYEKNVLWLVLINWTIFKLSQNRSIHKVKWKESIVAPRIL